MLLGLPFLNLSARVPRRLGVAALLTWFCLGCGPLHCLAAQRDESPTSDAEIARLIEGLAADSYAMRVRCRDRLTIIGLAAFEQLREARNHSDSEVAIVARRLTSGLQVQWSTPTDATEVIDLLSEYGSHGVPQRRKRIEAIAQLPPEDAFSPLLRLARFEPEPVLARAAALALIGLDGRDELPLSPITSTPNTDVASSVPNEPAATQIESSSLPPGRISSEWLQQYARDLRLGRLDVPAWEQLISQNRQQLAVDDSDIINESNISAMELLDLIQMTAERALAHDNPDVAVQLMVANVDLIPTKTQRLIETATWAIDHSLDRVVIAIYESQHKLIDKSPVLLYCVAEAFVHLDRDADAAKIAEAALAINPLSPTNDSKLHPQTIENNARAHVEIAAELVERGWFRWAEQEYELVIDLLPIDTAVSSHARSRLATMFADMQRHTDVVKTLTPLAERINQDSEFRDRLIARRVAYNDVQSNLDFHRALLMIENGESEAAKPILRKAYETNKENIDILIAMYRLDGDEQWTESVAKTLAEQIRSAQSVIDDARNNMQRVGPFRTSDLELAQLLNAYAWLVSNTTGDTDKALRFSKESLRIAPDRSALMDTCARCYFAAGDLEAAVKMQTRACELTPHSPPLQRQLNHFRDALQASQKRID